MNLESLQTQINSSEIFKLDFSLGESEQYRIKETLRPEIIDWVKNGNTNSTNISFDSTEDTIKILSR
ncbi:MAG: hypothetical protein QNJ32_04650 [Xenococcaceae cyanobacterium MO_167.B27]|nr:hypothetical protein [Xenococcaceae cyanobacterium MO_167.B27]